MPLLRTGSECRRRLHRVVCLSDTGSGFGEDRLDDMGLPRLDVPINLLTWEVSLPERLEVKQFGGNALSAEVFPRRGAETFWSDE